MNFHEIKSPLPGTFYRKPAPDAKPFAQEGDLVKVGDTIGIVEVMKQFTEITTDVSGLIVEFLVEDGAPVDPGQSILVIEMR